LENPSISIEPEFFGPFILVNNMVWPYMEVHSKSYSFWILNACDSRFLRLSFSCNDCQVKPQFTITNTEQGKLEKPVMTETLLLAPAERMYVTIDFYGFHGMVFNVTNDAPTPFPDGDSPDEDADGLIMQFIVKGGKNERSSPIQNLESTPIITDKKMKADNNRKLILKELVDEYGRVKPMLGTFEKGTLPWMANITETPKKGTYEEWEIFNLTNDAHPIHIHATHFNILNRQDFDVDKFQFGDPTSIIYTSQQTPPESYEMGLKDVAIVYPGEVLRLGMNWTKAGTFIWHCHIISHEDYEMMRPLTVVQ